MGSRGVGGDPQIVCLTRPYAGSEIDVNKMDGVAVTQWRYGELQLHKPLV